MITSIKKYGSYVLVRNSQYSQDIVDDPKEVEFVSTCTIPSHWVELPLLKIIQYNHDTSIFRFALPTTGAKELRLPVGAYLFVFAPGCEHDGSDGIRPYTSITDDSVQNNPNNPFSCFPLSIFVPSPHWRTSTRGNCELLRMIVSNFTKSDKQTSKEAEGREQR